jgi:hypothetical protein
MAQRGIGGLVAGDGVTSDAGNEDPQGALSDQDLLLGKQAVKIKTILCVVTFVACIGIAVFVFMNVPWDTRMPYDGKYNRSGDGIPMQIAMLPILVVLFGFWRSGKKPGAHHMGRASRVAYYILAPAIIVACVVGQWVMAQAILTAGGYLTG